MTAPLEKTIKKLIPNLSDEVIAILIANKKELALIFYEAYKPSIIKEKNEIESQLSWARELKLDIDYCRSLGDNAAKIFTSICETCQDKFAEDGDTARADKFTGIIGKTVASSGQMQENMQYATNELLGIIKKEKSFEKDSADTARMMREDINDGT